MARTRPRPSASQPVYETWSLCTTPWRWACILRLYYKLNLRTVERLRNLRPTSAAPRASHISRECLESYDCTILERRSRLRVGCTNIVYILQVSMTLPLYSYLTFRYAFGRSPRRLKSYTTSSTSFTRYLMPSLRFRSVSFLRLSIWKPAWISLMNWLIWSGRL